MDNNTISVGPTLKQIQRSLFLDYEKYLGNEGLVNFTMGGDVTWATIEAAKRLKNDEWELECYIPFTGGWRFIARYNTKTCTGVMLRTWQDVN